MKNFKYAITVGITLSILLVGIFVPTSAGDYAGIWWFVGGQVLEGADINYRQWGKTMGSGLILLLTPFIVRLIDSSAYKIIPGNPTLWFIALLAFAITSCAIMFLLV